ncbi:MAG: hypothetical protein AVDCRST_MAG13-2874, partial [uncultured Solirubrobacteraceae bacterium]
ERAREGLQADLRDGRVDGGDLLAQLPDRPAQRLDVVRDGGPAGEQRAEGDLGGHRGAEGRGEEPEDVLVAPGRLHLVHLVAEALEDPGGLPHRRLDHGVQAGVGQRRVEGERDPQAPGLAGRGVREGLGRRRRPGGVAELRAGQEVQEPRGLRHRPGEHAVLDEEGEADLGGRRDAPALGLEADQAAARRGDPGRAPAVVRVRDRDHAGGHGGARAAARPAGRAAGVPGVAGRPEAAGLRRGQDPELRHGGRADDDEARPPEPGDDVV